MPPLVSAIVSATPPVLAPLCPVEDPALDLGFQHISHDVDAPSPDHCQCQLPRLSRKLTKRRRPPTPRDRDRDHQLVSSSSGAAAAAAATGNPAAPVAAISQIASPVSSLMPLRAQSDHGHHPLRHSLSVKRASIIRKLSLRTPKLSFDSQATSSPSTGPTTPVSPSTKWQPDPSQRLHNDGDGPPFFLPLVRVTSPLSIHIPSDDIAPPASLNAHYHDLSISIPSRPRPKFTLGANDSESQVSTPPSPVLEPQTPNPSVRGLPAPPSRPQSPLNPQFLPPEQPPRRRWTFAMAMTDERITDEVLVQELERIRVRKQWSGSADDITDFWDPDYLLFGTFPSQPLPDSPQQDLFPHHHLLHSPPSDPNISYTPSLPSFPHQHRINTLPLPDTGSTQQWQTARRVLLTCRELVRTERHYLASLQALLASETDTPPPPLMLTYVQKLVNVSQSYLSQIEGNPSSWGVAAAFLSVEDAMDGAFFLWCSAVGTWFDNSATDETTAPAKTESRESVPPSSYHPQIFRKPTSQDDENKENEGEDHETTMARLRKMSSWRRRSWTLMSDAGSARKRERDSIPPSSFSLFGLQQRQNNNNRAKKPSIRDLAILPTQRITRYVLLYRDLIAHTPSTSPSRSLIKRAADAALRIAQKCNHAQSNRAFIVVGKDKNASTAAAPS